jgi:hypothetical protein
VLLKGAEAQSRKSLRFVYWNVNENLEKWGGPRGASRLGLVML